MSSDPERVARLKREAHSLAALTHLNVAVIYGLEETDGVVFLVLELVEGDTLEDRVRAGPIPVDDALRIAGQVAEGLEAAHGAGIIHRDLKPANIKITPEGRVKVLDFGLAKPTARKDRPGEHGLTHSPTITVEATGAGVLLGTAAYMSPEQARGLPLDKRTDNWSFGCVLFEMLTGTRTFARETVSDTLAAILEHEPEWEALPHDLVPQAQRVLRRCLRKDANRRLHDIADARIEIEEAVSEPSVALPRAPAGAPAGWRWAPPLASAAIAATVTGFAVWFWPAPAEVIRLSIGPIRLSGTPSGQRDVAVSADGTQVAHAAEGQIWLKPLDQADAMSVATGRTPFFSPNGEWIAFFSDGGLARISVNGGPARRIVPLSGGALRVATRVGPGASTEQLSLPPAPACSECQPRQRMARPNP